MIPRDKRQAPQRDLLETYLEDILNTRHELVQMDKKIDWTTYEAHFGRLYACNPDDGHTIESALKLTLLHANQMPAHLLAERGHRGNESTFLSKIHITGKRRGRGKAHPDQQHQ